MLTFSSSPKAYVALYLGHKRGSALTDKAQNIHDSITGNGNFATPGPYTLAELQTQIDATIAANAAAVMGTPLQKQQARDAEFALRTMLTAFAGYVQGVANEPANIVNAAAIILSAGMGLRKSRTINPVAEVVTEVKAMFTNIAGTIDLTWRRSKHAVSFNVMMSTDPENPASWTLAQTVGSHRTTVSGLESGTRYYFAIIAVGTGGASAPSDIANNVAA